MKTFSYRYYLMLVKYLGRTSFPATVSVISPCVFCLTILTQGSLLLSMVYAHNTQAYCSSQITKKPGIADIHIQILCLFPIALRALQLLTTILYNSNNFKLEK